MLLLATLAELESFFISSPGLYIALECAEYPAFPIIGFGKIGVKANGLLIGDQFLIIALEITEGSAFVDVGKRKVGVELTSLLIGIQCTSFVVVGKGIVGVKANGLPIGGQCFVVLLKTMKRSSLVQPSLCRLL